MKPIPILFLSDAPNQPTGLGRISRDLACLVSTMPEYRVGFLGLWGVGSRRLPFPVYVIDKQTGLWGENSLKEAWEDFAGRDAGILFTIWDISRFMWLAHPDSLPRDNPTRAWLQSRPFQLWGYFPVDCTFPQDRFPGSFTEAYRRFDRRLFYTAWARDLAARSLGVVDDWIPHGLNLNTWHPMNRDQAREMLSGVTNDDLVIGCVATNQLRKDWGLVFATIALLRDKLKRRIFLWAHTDLPNRYWDIPALARDFSLEKELMLTTDFTPEKLAQMYACCQATIAPGLGEGFGFPLVESLACGVPVVHGNYGGGAEIIQRKEWLVEPQAFRIEGGYNCVRPVFRPEGFAQSLLRCLTTPPEECTRQVEHLDWKKLWPSVWKKWFMKGAYEFTA